MDGMADLGFWCSFSKHRHHHILKVLPEHVFGGQSGISNGLVPWWDGAAQQRAITNVEQPALEEKPTLLQHPDLFRIIRYGQNGEDKEGESRRKEKTRRGEVRC